jgi:L-alanine-DL-glutamate epimerase-like enolase superfamily enzyme
VRLLGAVVLPGSKPGRPFVRLAVRTDRNILGLGEASPLPPYAPDQAMALAAILGEVCARLGPIDDDLPCREAIARAMAPVEAALASSREARFALETALFDVASVHRELSVAESLAGSGRVLARVACNGLLDASKGNLAGKARALADRGVSAIKVKLRARDEAGFERELDELRSLRCVLPPPFELRLDPNGAWNLAEAREKLARLASLEPRYVEQPVPAALLPDLGPTAVPWAADESLLLPGMAERLAEAEGCYAFILKPAVLGGLTTALAIAEIGASAGRELVVTHAFDGPVGLAAASEVSRALPKPPLACGLDPHEGLAAYPDLSLAQHTKPGYVTRANRPGLGFSEEERKRWLSTD